MHTPVLASKVDDVRPRLRKLTLRRFDRDPKNWMEFWNSFERVVNINPKLSDGNKFEYLRNSLEGKAKRSIAGFRLTEAIYRVALQMEFQHRTLRALGKKQERYSDVFVPMIENKLPENIRLSLYAKKGAIRNVNEMQAVLATEINIREKSKPTYIKKESQIYSRTAAERELTTASTLLVGGERKKFTNCYR